MVIVARWLDSTKVGEFVKRVLHSLKS